MLFSDAINGFPVYRKSKAGITAKEILKLCFAGDLPDKNVCKRVPVGVTESATFIVDLEAVHHKDLTVDDNGFYGAHSSPTEHFQVFIDGGGKVSAMCRISKPDPESESAAYDHFVIRRQYSWPRSDKNFRRMIAKVEHGGKFLRFAIVQYTVNMTPDEAKLLFSQTKRHSGTQVRTKPSVLERVRQLAIRSALRRLLITFKRKQGA